MKNKSNGGEHIESENHEYSPTMYYVIKKSGHIQRYKFMAGKKPEQTKPFSRVLAYGNHSEVIGVDNEKAAMLPL